MAWHILASSYFDFDAIDRDAADDRAPRHFLRYLSRQFGAPIHHPEGPGDAGSVTLFDRLGAILFAQPELWAMARRVRPKLSPGDGVYASGSTAGLPLALLCAVRGPRNVKFAVAVTDVQRPRVRLIGWLLAVLRLRWLMIVPHSQMIDVASKGFGRHLAGIMAVNGLTDFDFFRPADGRPEPSGDDRKALVASCGAEVRDYALLATATADLAVDVKVCFASPNLTGKTRFTLPNPVPGHMEIRHFDFVELRNLYQRADLVAVPLLPNRYAAGLTTVFEAVACGRPVVVARSPGPVDELIAEGLVSAYDAGDGDGLRRAIAEILDDPDAAQIRADRAHEWVRANYSAEAYLERIYLALELAFGDDAPRRQDSSPGQLTG